MHFNFQGQLYQLKSPAQARNQIEVITWDPNYKINKVRKKIEILAKTMIPPGEYT